MSAEQPIIRDEFFRELSYKGLDERLVHLFPDEAERIAQRPHYVERLEFEINTILKMGFPGYFLIVQDFINWAKDNGCPVGPGRGSGAGSLVAYALKITDLDPLKYNLLFERFLNPERVSMPDFDIDFCQGNRDRVIDYVKERYGRDAVSQIATFGTMAAKAALRDVGRVLGMGFGHVDSIAKLIPAPPGKHVTLAKVPEKPNPKLVYASMTAFGQDGPRGNQTAYDHVIQATSGMMAMTGTKDTNPIKVGCPAVDYATGMTGAFALSAALFQRQRTGRGQRIKEIGAKARALTSGRYHVSFEDVRALAHPVLRHRIITNFHAQSEGVTSDQIVDRLLGQVFARHDAAARKLQRELAIHALEREQIVGRLRLVDDLFRGGVDEVVGPSVLAVPAHAIDQ